MSLRRFTKTLIATNLKASFALRGAFWLQVGFMVLNNLIFFSVWWIFFEKFDEVRGWRIGDMALLYGVAAFGFGLAVVFGGGVRDLASAITNGDLDPYLTQPKPLLLHVALSRTYASGWGDFLSGAFLIGISGYVRLETLPFVVLAPLIAGVVLTSTAVLAQSLAFWLGPVDNLARQVWEFTVTFAVYPPSVYGMAVRVLIFTVLPAGFVTQLPVELVRSFSFTNLALALGGALFYLCASIWVFHRGLRRYESGNRFGIRV